MCLRDKWSGLCSATHCNVHMEQYVVIISVPGTSHTQTHTHSQSHLSLQHKGKPGARRLKCMQALLKKRQEGGEEGRAGVMGEGKLRRCHPPETYGGTHVWSRTKGGWRAGLRERMQERAREGRRAARRCDGRPIITIDVGEICNRFLYSHGYKGDILFFFSNYLENQRQTHLKGLYFFSDWPFQKILRQK